MHSSGLFYKIRLLTTTENVIDFGKCCVTVTDGDANHVLLPLLCEDVMLSTFDVYLFCGKAHFTYNSDWQIFFSNNN